MIKIVGVRFRSAGKVYYFDPKDLQLRTGDHVIAETSKGQDYGIISTCMKMVDEELVQQPLRAIVRKATVEDEEKIDALRVREKEALRVCREKVREHELDMKMVNAEYSFDGTKVLFYFTADGRVDFRSLVKDLAGIFHVRIELRQIGVRDETRMLGGIGICGRELCCATFLRDFQPVSIKMAKEQNLSLNPTKISGTCGRLMCCLKNEEATYEFLNARMPKMGEEAITADGQTGKVIELDVLRQRVRVLFEEGDTKVAEVFPVEELTFRPKKKDPAQQGKKPRGEKTGKGGKDEKTGKTGKAGRAEKAGHAEGEEKPERSMAAANREKPEHAGRSERPEHAGKTEKAERSMTAANREKPEHAGRSERPEHAGKTEKAERSMTAANREKPEHAGKAEKAEHAGRAEKEDRAEKKEMSERKRPHRRRNPRPDEGAAPAGKEAGGAEQFEEKNAVKRNRRHRPRPKTEDRDGTD